MKRFVVLALAILFGFGLRAQESTSSGLAFLSFTKLYHNAATPDSLGERSNIDRFFAEWEAWSESVAKDAAVGEYNNIFNRHFCENNNDGSKYFVVPLRVKVVKYDENIGPDYVGRSIGGGFVYTNTPDSISYFTPIIKSGKKVLYLMPQAVDLLTDFMKVLPEDSEPPAEEWGVEEFSKWLEEVDNRKSVLSEYIPTIVAHGFNGWRFTSYPLIDMIVVGKDGYYINLKHADHYGQEFFVPWGKEPISMSKWIA